MNQIGLSYIFFFLTQIPLKFQRYVKYRVFDQNLAIRSTRCRASGTQNCTREPSELCCTISLKVVEKEQKMDSNDNLTSFFLLIDCRILKGFPLVWKLRFWTAFFYFSVFFNFVPLQCLSGLKIVPDFGLPSVLSGFFSPWKVWKIPNTICKQEKKEHFRMGGSHGQFFLRAHRATAVKHSFLPGWLANGKMSTYIQLLQLLILYYGKKKSQLFSIYAIK